MRSRHATTCAQAQQRLLGLSSLQLIRKSNSNNSDGAIFNRCRRRSAGHSQGELALLRLRIARPGELADCGQPGLVRKQHAFEIQDGRTAPCARVPDSHRRPDSGIPQFLTLIRARRNAESWARQHSSWFSGTQASKTLPSTRSQPWRRATQTECNGHPAPCLWAGRKIFPAWKAAGKVGLAPGKIRAGTKVCQLEVRASRQSPGHASHRQHCPTIKVLCLCSTPQPEQGSGPKLGLNHSGRHSLAVVRRSLREIVARSHQTATVVRLGQAIFLFDPRSRAAGEVTRAATQEILPSHKRKIPIGHLSNSLRTSAN